MNPCMFAAPTAHNHAFTASFHTFAEDSMNHPLLPRAALLTAIALIGCTDPSTSPASKLVAPEGSSLSVIADDPTYVLLANST